MFCTAALARPSRGFVCRYSCAYDKIRKRAYWDTALSGGPVVEQATHFIDLMRLFGGQIVPETIRAVAAGPDCQLSAMPDPPFAEHEVAHPPLILYH